MGRWLGDRRHGVLQGQFLSRTTCPIIPIKGHVAYPPERGFCPVLGRVFWSWCGVKRDGVIHPVSLLLTAMSHGVQTTIGAYGQSSCRWAGRAARKASFAGCYFSARSGLV